MGGLSLSAILTPAIVPPLLSIVMQTVETARAERLANKKKTLINEAQVIEVFESYLGSINLFKFRYLNVFILGEDINYFAEGAAGFSLAFVIIA